MENPKFPVKWTAPEALSDKGSFTIKCDVWSYGVLIWQMCSAGKTPFEEMTNVAVSKIIILKAHFHQS